MKVNFLKHGSKLLQHSGVSWVFCWSLLQSRSNLWKIKKYCTNTSKIHFLIERCDRMQPTMVILLGTSYYQIENRLVGWKGLETLKTSNVFLNRICTFLLVSFPNVSFICCSRFFSIQGKQTNWDWGGRVVVETPPTNYSLRWFSKLLWPIKFTPSHTNTVYADLSTVMYPVFRLIFSPRVCRETSWINQVTEIGAIRDQWKLLYWTSFVLKLRVFICTSEVSCICFSLRL